MNKQAYWALGNLTRDSELKYLEGGKSLLKFTVAVNDRYKDGNGDWKDGEPLFLDCTIWGKAGEKFSREFVKGAFVWVSGVLKMERWTDRETEAKREKIVLNVFDTHLADIPKNEQGGGDDRGRGRDDDRGRGRDDRPRDSARRDERPRDDRPRDDRPRDDRPRDSGRREEGPRDRPRDDRPRDSRPAAGGGGGFGSDEDIPF